MSLNESQNNNTISSKSNVITFNLCSFLGIFGIHRFYVGRKISGFIQLITLGGLLIWTIIDWFTILKENFVDKENKRLIWPIYDEYTKAGFWIRFSAHIIDIIIISILTFLIISPIFLINGSIINDLSSVIEFSIIIFYYTFFHCSEKQATFGKRIVGIYVTDNKNNRMTLTRSIARTISYFFSYVTILIGFIMCGIRKDKKTLHDIITDTNVIYGRVKVSEYDRNRL